MGRDFFLEAKLRDNANKSWNVVREIEDVSEKYIEIIKNSIKEGYVVIDIGCGTGDIIQTIGDLITYKNAKVIGLDISAEMIKVAKINNISLKNARWIVGNEKNIPLADNSIDIVLSRLAEYTPKEIYRILKPSGLFIEYGLGPLDSQEIAIAFKERYENEYITTKQEEWFKNRQKLLSNFGINTEKFEVFNGNEYLTYNQLLETITMVPLVRDFPKESDYGIIASMPIEKRDEWKEPLFRIKRQVTLRVSRKNGE